MLAEHSNETLWGNPPSWNSSVISWPLLVVLGYFCQGNHCSLCEWWRGDSVAGNATGAKKTDVLIWFKENQDWAWSMLYQIHCTPQISKFLSKTIDIKSNYRVKTVSARPQMAVQPFHSQSVASQDASLLRDRAEGSQRRAAALERENQQLVVTWTRRGSRFSIGWIHCCFWHDQIENRLNLLKRDWTNGWKSYASESIKWLK